MEDVVNEHSKDLTWCETASFHGISVASERASGVWRAMAAEKVMEVIKYLPVCPESWGLHNWQAPTMAYLKPGMWVQRLAGLQTCWASETWLMKGADASAVVEALKKCNTLKEQCTKATHPALRAADFQTREARSDFFSCFFFTPRKKWLDVCEIKLRQEADGIYADAFSCSTGIVPTAVIGCTPLSALFSPIPFDDWGQNQSHLRTLRQLIADEGIGIEKVATKEKSS
eukprot:scaffold227802_cov30-Tisochrysis_lutea.AAC.1